jgi:hypothetical protein
VPRAPCPVPRAPPPPSPPHTRPWADLEDPNATLALRLEIEVPYVKKHPFRREYDVLEAMMPHHGNVVALWHGWNEESIVPKVAKMLPQFILTRFEDKISVKPDWVPKVGRGVPCPCVWVGLRRVAYGCTGPGP